MPDSWARDPSYHISDSKQKAPQEQANMPSQTLEKQQPLRAKPGLKRKAPSALVEVTEQAGSHHRHSFDSYRNPVTDQDQDEIPATVQTRNALVRKSY
jgi:hypothetical protein